MAINPPANVTILSIPADAVTVSAETLVDTTGGRTVSVSLEACFAVAGVGCARAAELNAAASFRDAFCAGLRNVSATAIGCVVDSATDVGS